MDTEKLHHNGLVEVNYSFEALRNLLDSDIGWGPYIPALQFQPNYGEGEIIQGPKPKKRKRVVIEKSEFDALLNLTERVARLEQIVASQVELMKAKDVFNLRGDPSFALKLAQTWHTCSMGVETATFKPSLKIRDETGSSGGRMFEHCKLDVGSSKADKRKSKLYEGAGLTMMGYYHYKLWELFK